MTLEWPLTERELLIAGRARRTYFTRSVVAIIMIAPFAIVWLMGSLLGNTMHAGNTSGLGQFVAGLATVVQFFVAYFATGSHATSTILDERQERTLELLALADPKGWDVALSKWLGVVVQSVLLLLAVLPVQAIAALFGGVDIRIATLQTFYFVCIACSVAALGMFASAVARNFSQANAYAVGFVLIWFFVAFIADNLLGAFGFGFFGANFFLLQVFSYAPPIVALPIYSLATCVVCIGITSRLIRRHVSGASSVQEPGYVKQVLPTRDPKQYEKPVAGMIARVDDGSNSAVAAVAQIGVLMLAFLVPVLGTLIPAGMIARQTARTLTTLKRDGGWDELLITRTDDRTFVRQTVRGLRRRTIILHAAIALNIIMTIFMSGWLNIWAVPYVMIASIYAGALIPHGAFAATAGGTIRQREVRGGMTWILWILNGIFGPWLFYGFFIGFGAFSFLPHLRPESLVGAYIVFNVIWAALGGWLPLRLFSRRFHSIPNIGERRVDIA